MKSFILKGLFANFSILFALFMQGLVLVAGAGISTLRFLMMDAPVFQKG